MNTTNTESAICFSTGGESRSHVKAKIAELLPDKGVSLAVFSADTINSHVFHWRKILPHINPTTFVILTNDDMGLEGGEMYAIRSIITKKRDSGMSVLVGSVGISVGWTGLCVHKFVKDLTAGTDCKIHTSDINGNPFRRQMKKPK